MPNQQSTGERVTELTSQILDHRQREYGWADSQRGGIVQIDGQRWQHPIARGFRGRLAVGETFLFARRPDRMMGELVVRSELGAYSPQEMSDVAWASLIARMEEAAAGVRYPTELWLRDPRQGGDSLTRLAIVQAGQEPTYPTDFNGAEVFDIVNAARAYSPQTP